MKARLYAAAIMMLAAGAAAAADFTAVRLDRSAVSFVSKQMGVPVDGQFRKFSAQIAIDPAQPEAGRARIDIDLASIDAGALVDDEVKGRNWFDVRQFPSASFVSGSVKSLGGGRFEATGKMTIKGKTQEVRAPFTVKQDNGMVVLDGAFVLQRLAFGIGSGEWGDPSVVADDVQIKFRFVVAAK